MSTTSHIPPKVVLRDERVDVVEVRSNPLGRRGHLVTLRRGCAPGTVPIMNEDVEPSPGTAAIVAFVIPIIAGVIMGTVVSATVTEQGFGAEYATMTERAMDGVTSTFNWLIFSLFACAAFVASAAAWAGSTAARAQWQTRQLAGQAAARPTAARADLDPPTL
jgi:hypothetical protein